MSLLNQVKTNQELRKIFGQRELKIIEKQLLGVALTPSEKIRLSRDIRKKFNVIQTLSKYGSEFNLKKGTENKKLLQEFLERTKQTEYFPRIQEILLFGSAVDNELTPLSDLDIAIKIPNITQKQAIKLCSALKLSDKLDIQVYNLLPKKIQDQIDNKSKVLYKK